MLRCEILSPFFEYLQQGLLPVCLSTARVFIYNSVSVLTRLTVSVLTRLTDSVLTRLTARRLPASVFIYKFRQQSLLPVCISHLLTFEV